MVSNVLPSWPLTNSLLMKLQAPGSACGLERLVGGGEISSDKTRGKADDGQESPSPTVQYFEVRKLMKKLKMSERLTVLWVARICPLQAFLELLKETC